MLLPLLITSEHHDFLNNHPVCLIVSKFILVTILIKLFHFLLAYH